MQKLQVVGGSPTTTGKYTFSTDASQSLVDMLAAIGTVVTIQKGSSSNYNLVNALSAEVTVETQSCRFGYGTINQATGHILTAGQGVTLQGYPELEDVEFANETAGSNAVLQITISF